MEAWLTNSFEHIASTQSRMQRSHRSWTHPSGISTKSCFASIGDFHKLKKRGLGKGVPRYSLFLDCWGTLLAETVLLKESLSGPGASSKRTMDRSCMLLYGQTSPFRDEERSKPVSSPYLPVTGQVARYMRSPRQRFREVCAKCGPICVDIKLRPCFHCQNRRPQ
jgi:hypothetical protein